VFLSAEGATSVEAWGGVRPCRTEPQELIPTTRLSSEGATRIPAKQGHLARIFSRPFRAWSIFRIFLGLRPAKAGLHPRALFKSRLRRSGL